MLKKQLTLISALVMVGIIIFTSSNCARRAENPISMAVEFMNHAACAYISQDKGWFEEEGLKLTAYESYVTGMALASALARADIEVAYICLVPAINVYANAKVPIKIVAGTHKYGYGLVANPEIIRTVEDLEKHEVRIGCVREGGAVDVLLHKTIDKYDLDESKILNNIQRMNPPMQVLAIKTERLDAAFLPEQWATMAEEQSNFRMLLMAQDLWPEIQGSVIAVKTELIRKHPEAVSKLVKVSQKATDWSNQHPDQAAQIVAQQLRVSRKEFLPLKVAKVAAKLEISPKVLQRSMARLEYTTAIDPEVVQATIDYLAELGYIKSSFNAKDILDLRFLK